MRRFPALLASIPVAGLLLPSAALAQGMPQLAFGNPLTIAQVVWGGMIFLVLYLALSRWALPQVGAVLQARAASIADDLDAAHAAKAAADAAMAEMTEATRLARSEAQAAISAAVDKAKAEAAAEALATSRRLEARLAEAEAQIAQARNAAMAALRQVATDTTLAMVTKLTGTRPGKKSIDGAVGVALAARGQT